MKEVENTLGHRYRVIYRVRMYKISKTTENILESIAVHYCMQNQAYDCPCKYLIDELVKLGLIGL